MVGRRYRVVKQKTNPNCHTRENPCTQEDPKLLVTPLVHPLPSPNVGVQKVSLRRNCPSERLISPANSLSSPRISVIWPVRCRAGEGSTHARGEPLTRRKPEKERRRWVRLPLAIPVFVRSRDEKGTDLLEFATALNISAGGALVVVRRSPVLSSSVLLEIPSAPIADGASLPRSSRTLRAKPVRITHTEGYHLLGLKFSRPLLTTETPVRPARRKVASSM
jgi:PilZ domain